MSTHAAAPLRERSLPAFRHQKLEVLLPVAILVLIAATFWSAQRYPALLHKLHSGAAVQMRGTLSFDALLPVTPTMPLAGRVARTSVNWLWTNRFGMFFALPFGAAAMTLLGRTNRPKGFASAPANILCGAVAGAPLGVCTNCATPIAQSLLASGASSRLTVAAMISSPSFNPVVLAMAFLLFPAPLALARVAAPALLLALLPALVPENRRAATLIAMPTPQAALAHRLRALAAAFGRNLLRLTLLTLPWMLLAALLGALAAEFIPAYGTRMPVSIPGIAAVALLGTILPVPMALDVALAFVLYRAGVPLPYVAALLCTLGPVSIYSLSALAQQLGRRSALRLAGATALLGSCAGWLVLLQAHR